jgi:hypothetical protein
LYPATPALSDDALHERFIWLVETASAVNPVGIEGELVSGGNKVV